MSVRSGGRGDAGCVCFQSLEEKEELELCCTQLKGDTRMYRQRNKQTLRQLEEVIRERDKVRSPDPPGWVGWMLIDCNDHSDMSLVFNLHVSLPVPVKPQNTRKVLQVLVLQVLVLQFSAWSLLF